MSTVQTSIRLPHEDIELAKAQADKRGIKYQTYLKMIIHEEIWKEYKEINMAHKKVAKKAAKKVVKKVAAKKKPMKFQKAENDE